jgi:hypothetical protein
LAKFAAAIFSMDHVSGHASTWEHIAKTGKHALFIQRSYMENHCFLRRKS